jgi:hypothetical protein
MKPHLCLPRLWFRFHLHTSISLTHSWGYQSQSALSSKWIVGSLEFYVLPHCIPFVFFKYLTNPKYMISNWPILSKPTLTIPSNFVLHRQQVKYSQTLIYHNPHLLTPMVECKQKFPIMCCFNVLPLSTYCHPQYPTTNWGEQVVALYCTILYMWWHKDELWLEEMKINHLKT